MVRLQCYLYNYIASIGLFVFKKLDSALYINSKNPMRSLITQTLQHATATNYNMSVRK